MSTFMHLRDERGVLVLHHGDRATQDATIGPLYALGHEQAAMTLVTPTSGASLPFGRHHAGRGSTAAWGVRDGSWQDYGQGRLGTAPAARLSYAAHVSLVNDRTRSALRRSQSNSSFSSLRRAQSSSSSFSSAQRSTASGRQQHALTAAPMMAAAPRHTLPSHPFCTSGSLADLGGAAGNIASLRGAYGSNVALLGESASLTVLRARRAAALAH